jgi:hypothetical protein
MALLTRKQFAEQCFINTRALSVFIQRKKVVLSNDLIDTEVDDNRYFLEKKREFKRNKDIKSGVITEETFNERVIDQTKQEVQPQFEFPHESAAPISENFKLDSKIKQASLEKTALDIQILQAKRDKITGESVPTTLVKTLITHHAKSIIIAFQNGIDNILVTISKRKGFSSSELGELREEMIDLINASSNESIEISKKTLENIILEYSQRKDVGERE